MRTSVRSGRVGMRVECLQPSCKVVPTLETVGRLLTAWKSTLVQGASLTSAGTCLFMSSTTVKLAVRSFLPVVIGGLCATTSTSRRCSWRGTTGDEGAHGRLVDVVYDELRRVARWHLRGEGANHSLAPTALVHETYLKLVDQRRVRWQNRAHFFGVASRLMRRVLVNHARSRGAVKRGTDQTIVLDGVEVGIPPLDVDILALDAALDRLATVGRATEQARRAPILRRADGRRKPP